RPKFTKPQYGSFKLFFAPERARGLLMQALSAALNGRTSTKDRICRYRCRMFPCAIHTTLVVAVLIAVGFYIRSRSAKPLTEKDNIVLTDFANTTGDAVFDDALKQALGVDLEQSPFLNVLSDRKMGETLRLMGRQPNDRITREVAQEICL